MGDQEKIMWNIQGSWFLPLEFRRDLTKICGITRSRAFCLESPPPVLAFSGISQSLVLRG